MSIVWFDANETKVRRRLICPREIGRANQLIVAVSRCCCKLFQPAAWEVTYIKAIPQKWSSLMVAWELPEGMAEIEDT